MKTQIVEKKSNELVKVSEKFCVVKTEDEARAASSFVAEKLKPMEKEIHDAFDPIVSDALKAHRTAVAKRAQYLTPIENAIKGIRIAIGKFATAEQERKRKEREKQEAEAMKKQEKLQEKAEIARAEGKEEKANELEMKANSHLVMPKESDKPKVDGTAMKTIWECSVVNKADILKAISSGTLPDSFVDVNEQAIKKYISATEGKVLIPGVVFKKTLVTSFR